MYALRMQSFFFLIAQFKNCQMIYTQFACSEFFKENVKANLDDGHFMIPNDRQNIFKSIVIIFFNNNKYY